MQNERMDKNKATATTSATGRGTVTRIQDARRPARRPDSLARALEARRQLRPRSERFAHLKRMYD